MWAAQAMPKEVDSTADLAALGPRPPPVPQSAAGVALHMPSTIPEEPEDLSMDPTSGGVITPRTCHGGSTARGSTTRDRDRDRDRSIAEIVLEESISLTEALANVEMAREQSDESSLSQWLGDDGDAGSATLPLSETLMPASLLGPGMPASGPLSRSSASCHAVRMHACPHCRASSMRHSFPHGLVILVVCARVCGSASVTAECGSTTSRCTCKASRAGRRHHCRREHSAGDQIF